jgi:hypothetical protein
MAKESETDRKLLAWLERNGPWLMKLDPQKIQWRIGLELDHGRLLGRSVDESLLVAGSVLRQEYEDGGEGHSQQTSSQEEEEQEEDAGRTGNGTSGRNGGTGGTSTGGTSTGGTSTGGTSTGGTSTGGSTP